MLWSKPPRSSVPFTVNAEIELKAVVDPAASVAPLSMVVGSL
jgi:hypothetical protein